MFIINIMSKTIPYGRLGNQVIRNLAASFICSKNDLYIEYSSYDIIKKLGIILHIGKKRHKNTVRITDNNYLDFYNKNELLEANIDMNHNFFQTEEITNIIKRHLFNNRMNIIDVNKYKERYSNNNDIFIHIRLGDVTQRNPGVEYYLSCIEKISSYHKIYISSDSPDHNIIKTISETYPLNVEVFKGNEIDTIHFGSTCKYIVLSHGSFSGVIGYISFFSENIYYPDSANNGWCPMGMFTGKGWIPM